MKITGKESSLVLAFKFILIVFVPLLLLIFHLGTIGAILAGKNAFFELLGFNVSSSNWQSYFYINTFVAIATAFPLLYMFLRPLNRPLNDMLKDVYIPAIFVISAFINIYMTSNLEPPVTQSGSYTITHYKRTTSLHFTTDNSQKFTFLIDDKSEADIQSQNCFNDRITITYLEKYTVMLDWEKDC